MDREAWWATVHGVAKTLDRVEALTHILRFVDHLDNEG